MIVALQHGRNTKVIITKINNQDGNSILSDENNNPIAVITKHGIEVFDKEIWTAVVLKYAPHHLDINIMTV